MQNDVMEHSRQNDDIMECSRRNDDIIECSRAFLEGSQGCVGGSCHKR